MNTDGARVLQAVVRAYPMPTLAAPDSSSSFPLLSLPRQRESRASDVAVAPDSRFRGNDIEGWLSQKS